MCVAGFCGGEQIGAMRSQLGASIDLDAAIADYSFVIDSPLTYPGTTNHAVTCARRGEHAAVDQCLSLSLWGGPKGSS